MGNTTKCGNDMIPCIKIRCMRKGQEVELPIIWFQIVHITGADSAKIS